MDDNPNPLKPDTSILVKLGSIVRHSEEAIGAGGHVLDIEALKSLFNDFEIIGWLTEMDKMALLPVKR
jgi:hypothetical protein